MKNKHNPIAISNAVLIFSIVFFLNSCAVYKEKNDLATDNLKGAIASFTETSYKAIEHLGNLEKGEKERESWEEDFQMKYNNKGNKIEWSLYNSDGNLNTKHIYSYNKKGNMIEENSYNPNGSLKYKGTYSYDKKGNRIEGNIYSPDGSLNYKLTYSYNKKGNIIEANEYNPDGSLEKKYTFKYDEKGNKIESNTMYIFDDSFNQKCTYGYDEKGNTIEDNCYKSDGSLDKLTYKYDEKGNMIEYNWYKPDGSLSGNITYAYTYNKKGNWLTKTTYLDKTATYILKRTYKYYN